jgi:GT2 family glycosyltransferase
MNEKKHDIAVIIINYNSSGYTINAIDSVLKSTSEELDIEIIVVDNASGIADYEKLHSYISRLNLRHVFLFRSRINTGFGGGNMQGVQHANAAYYLFLNNDTLLLNDALLICHDFMRSSPEAAVCGAQIFNDQSVKQLSFDHFSTPLREIFGKKMVEFLYPVSKPSRRKTYFTPLEVDYVNGSFMFFRASDFDDIGGFDTNIFLYFEESDICFRLRKAGRKTFFVPDASYLHFHGQSIKKSEMPIEMKIELKTSMFYVIRKNQGYLKYQLLRLFFILRYALVSIVKPHYFKLLIAILLGLPLGRSLKQRQLIVDQVIKYDRDRIE